MKKILGIDTTTSVASCSVYVDNMYFTESIDNKVTHSEKLLPLVDKTLIESGIDLDSVDMLAVTNGPGSFTGIRIGLATIKAFAQVKNLNIYSISSIDLISYVAAKNESNSCYVLSLIDARNNRVYYGINEIVKENGKYTINKVFDVKNDDILDMINAIKDIVKDKKIIIAGNCVNEFKDKLKEICSNFKEFYPTTDDLIDSYLYMKDTSNYMYNAYSLDALYARPSQAERMKKDE